MSIPLTFHHYGLAVTDPVLACSFLADLGYRVGAPLLDPEQNVNLIWSEHDAMPAVEVVYPSGSGAGPLDAVLRQNNSLVYHLCYECDSLEDAIRIIAEHGYRTMRISPAKPAVLFGGRRVGFYMIKGFGLIELVERQGT